MYAPPSVTENLRHQIFQNTGLAIGATNDLSIYYTANHGPPPCSGPGASAPPSPMVTAALRQAIHCLGFLFRWSISEQYSVEHRLVCLH